MASTNFDWIENVTATDDQDLPAELWGRDAATTATVLVSLITSLIISSNILNIIVWQSVIHVAPATRVN